MPSLVIAARRPCGSGPAIVRTSRVFFIAFRSFVVDSTGVVSGASIGLPSSIRVALPFVLRKGTFWPSGASWTNTLPSRHALSTVGAISDSVSASLPINSTCSLTFDERIAFASKFRAVASSASALAVTRTVTATKAMRNHALTCVGTRRNAGFVPLGALRRTLFCWRSTLGVARNLLALERSLQEGLAENIVERVDYFELPA